MTHKYDKDYFERGVETGKSLYSNYRWIPELTIPMCAELIMQLKIGPEDTILDFGCAKGFIVKALRLLHREAYGVDISEYAIKQASEDVAQYLSPVSSAGPYPVFGNKRYYDWAIAKDVLEHIAYNDIDRVLANLSDVCHNAFIVVPLGNSDKYYVDSYELDVTHIIREELDWWAHKFARYFNVISQEYKMKHIKENYSQYKKGNGFFILHSLNNND